MLDKKANIYALMGDCIMLCERFITCFIQGDGVHHQGVCGQWWISRPAVARMWAAMPCPSEKVADLKYICVCGQFMYLLYWKSCMWLKHCSLCMLDIWIIGFSSMDLLSLYYVTLQYCISSVHHSISGVHLIKDWTCALSSINAWVNFSIFDSNYISSNLQLKLLAKSCK